MRHFGLCALILAASASFGGVQAMAQSHYATRQSQENYDAGIKLERQAEQRGDSKYLEEAAAQYRQAISADPSMYQAYVRLGYVLYALKQSQDAVQYLETGLQRSPDNIELKHYLGLNYYQVGRLDEAESLLKDVIVVRQDLPEAYFVLGKIYLDRGDAAKAQPYFEQYAELSPNDAQAYRALSSAYIQAHNIQNAEAALTTLLELAPDDNIARINMGHIQYERGHIDDAVEYYEKAYARDPSREDLLYTIASVYYLSGRYEEAIKRFAVVLEKDNTHMAAQYFTADSELKLGHLDTAEKLFLALSEKMPDYKYIRLKLAYIRMLRGDQNAADEVRELMKSTDNPDDLHFGAVMLRKNGAVDESIVLHTRLYEDTNDGKYAVYLAREYLELQKYDEAIALLKNVAGSDKNSPLVTEMLSLTLLNQGIDAMMTGDFDKARELFEQSRSLGIHQVPVYCSLSQLALLEGDSDKAFEYFQEAEKLSPSDANVTKLAAQFDIMDGEYAYAVRRLTELSSRRNDNELGGGGWYLMAVAQSHTGDWHAAGKSLDEAEKCGVIDAQAAVVVALELAMQAYEQGNMDELNAQLEKVGMYQEVLDDVDRVRYLYLSAISHIKARKFTLARSELENVKSGFDALPASARSSVIENGKLDLSYEIAYVNYEAGNYDAALNAISKKSGDNEFRTLEAAIRRKLAMQAMRSRKMDTAIDHYNRLNTISNLSPADQYNLTIAKLEANKLKSDDGILEKMARQNNAEAVLNYAIYLDNLGDGAKAMQYYQKYVNMSGAKKAAEVNSMLSTKQRVWGDNAAQ